MQYCSTCNLNSCKLCDTRQLILLARVTADQMLLPAPVWHPEQVLLPALPQYHGEQDLETVMQLVDNELSEPYSIFTYRWGPCCCAVSRACSLCVMSLASIPEWQRQGCDSAFL